MSNDDWAWRDQTPDLYPPEPEDVKVVPGMSTAAVMRHAFEAASIGYLTYDHFAKAHEQAALAEEVPPTYQWLEEIPFFRITKAFLLMEPDRTVSNEPNQISAYLIMMLQEATRNGIPIYLEYTRLGGGVVAGDFIIHRIKDGKVEIEEYRPTPWNPASM
jgi:hypothetical protein